jgi:hypothetical protein
MKTLAEKWIESIAGMSIVCVRMMIEKIVCKYVSVHYSKYHFIDSNTDNISFFNRDG